jgi:hypothetical protein
LPELSKYEEEFQKFESKKESKQMYVKYSWKCSNQFLDCTITLSGCNLEKMKLDEKIKLEAKFCN